MQLNEFDNLILKLPNTGTNVFTDKDKADRGVWVTILSIANFFFPLISMIIALVLRGKDKDSALLGYLANQGLWMFILTLVNLIPVVGQIIWMFLGMLVIYGNIAERYFDLPLVGNIKLIKY